MWGSHLPALLTAIGSSNGPVLELGVGYFSTPALHAICGALKRRLMSVEQNAEWCERFKYLENPIHRIANHTNEEFFKLMGNYEHLCKWGVAFIDHSPGGASRAEAFRILAPISSYVVVHDYHLENEEHIAPLLTGFKTVRVFNTQQPPTLVASLNYELPESADQL